MNKCQDCIAFCYCLERRELPPVVCAVFAPKPTMPPDGLKWWLKMPELTPADAKFTGLN
jgi:hypothetical protein